MSQASQTIATYVDLLRTARLNTYTKNQLEFILYQLNLAMLKVEGSRADSLELPFKPAEIELLNGLIVAAESSSGGSQGASKELAERLFQIISRFHAANDGLEIRHVCKERH